MNWKILLLMTSVFFVAMPSEARWVEAQGTARIINGDIDTARQKAIENALQQALLASGGNISSIQQVVDGVLQNTQTQWTSQGNVDQVTIVREEVRDDRVIVRLRADIWNREGDCARSSYKNSVTVVPFELRDRSHGTWGQIWDIGEVAAERLARELGGVGSQLHITHTLQRHAGLEQALSALNLEELGRMARSLGLVNDSQFIIFGMFDDLAMMDTSSNWLWPSDPNRHYALTLYLLDATTGQLVTRARVEDTQPWTFDRTVDVDVAAAKFWNQPFGAALDSGLRDLAAGVKKQVICKPVRARIIEVDAKTVLFNLGEKHGVSLGDKLKIVQPTHFTDDQGRFRLKWQVSEFEVEVSQVQQSTAIAELTKGNMLHNVQVSDWVVPIN
ncbi:flagellar assembly protein FlgT [Idiomarina sp. HP20-50]|uniref:flagellar assembly protein FlgT n=1 Tax=Idiomarina sp. HP20-50 TaxID=3070813 RepID=UPI00294B3C34|nr:flagellar assembly protein FlgT [Idiomarina sp. HP20-50]MDV6316995.1 flagellar assembly protein FlgT [Idiomarina sp. HP20-50]